jgi:hypothetical protein
MTSEQLDEMYERSKDDRAVFVGSEIRQLIGMIRRLQLLVLELDVAQIPDDEFIALYDEMTKRRATLRRTR